MAGDRAASAPRAPPCAMETPRHGLIVPPVPARPRYGEYFSRRAHRKRRRARCSFSRLSVSGLFFPVKLALREAASPRPPRHRTAALRSSTRTHSWPVRRSTRTRCGVGGGDAPVPTRRPRWPGWASGWSRRCETRSQRWFCRGTATSSRRRWIVAATGIAISAPMRPRSVPPISVAMMVRPGVTLTVCFITLGFNR